MNKTKISVFAFFLLTTFPVQAEPKVEWKLVWQDDFHKSGAPDEAKWKHQTGNDGFGNQEAQFYTDRLENSRVEKGRLLIEARKEDFGSSQYTSARLVSRASWQYGRFEVRAKLPTGRGTWPAIWMLPEKWPHGDGGWPDNGEVDIMEHVGFDPGVVHGSLHMKTYNWMNRNEKTATIQVPNFDSEFHTYAFEWTGEELSLFVDQMKYFTYKNPHQTWAEWPFDGKFQFILNLAIGGSWGGKEGIDDSIFPQKLIIEHVRVYQRVR